MQGIGEELAEQDRGGAGAGAAVPDLNDVVRRAGLTAAQAEALATAGAFDGFGLSRRQALWNAGYADSASTLPGSAIDAAPPALPGMSPVELTLADIWATTISPDDHPVQHLRPVLDQHDIVPIVELGEAYAGAGSGSPAWSLTGSGLAPRRGSPSSTWRTRPAC